MAFSSASILLFALLLFNVCWADNVTLYLDDPRFVTTSQFSNSDLCGNSGWTNSTGDSVSLTFGGTLITINFIAEGRGAIAQIALDGTNVSQSNTYRFGVHDSKCTRLSWTSGALSQGNHTITVTQLDRGNATIVSAGFVWMRNFVYTAAAEPSSMVTSNPGPTVTAPVNITGHKLPAGVIVGAVLGAIVTLLFFIGMFFFYRRRRQHPKTLPDPQSDPTYRYNMAVVKPSLPFFLPSSTKFPANVSHLSQDQLNLVKTLAARNVPRSALATVWRANA